MSARTDFSRAEAVAGLIWLSIGAIVSLTVEVAFVGGAVGAVAAPLAALGFNAVLTKTARLWTPSTWIALVPLVVWVSGFFAGMLVLPAFGFAPVPANAGAVVLLLAGLAGGVWPLFRAK